MLPTCAGVNVVELAPVILEKPVEEDVVELCHCIVLPVLPVRVILAVGGLLGQKVVVPVYAAVPPTDAELIIKTPVAVDDTLQEPLVTLTIYPPAAFPVFGDVLDPLVLGGVKVEFVAPVIGTFPLYFIH